MKAFTLLFRRIDQITNQLHVSALMLTCFVFPLTQHCWLVASPRRMQDSLVHFALQVLQNFPVKRVGVCRIEMNFAVNAVPTCITTVS